jgi:phosphoglycolate phosphatase-like HAD superfamily hydrolase
MHVVLFDIEGTLVHTGGSGVEALRRAFWESFNRRPPDRIETSGRTDRGIARTMLLASSLDDSQANWERFHTAYLRHLAAFLPKGHGRILPGVSELLGELSRRSHIRLGLLTGNTAAGARLKLEHFGLHQHFAFGGFGDHFPERNGIAAAALQAAGCEFDGQLCLERVWVVGDTPLDISCARHIGARAVGVATGIHPRSELEAARPDLILDDLSACTPLLELVDDVLQ